MTCMQVVEQEGAGNGLLSNEQKFEIICPNLGTTSFIQSSLSGALHGGGPCQNHFLVIADWGSICGNCRLVYQSPQAVICGLTGMHNCAPPEDAAVHQQLQTNHIILTLHVVLTQL